MDAADVLNLLCTIFMSICIVMAIYAAISMWSTGNPKYRPGVWLLIANALLFAIINRLTKMLIPESETAILSILSGVVTVLAIVLIYRFIKIFKAIKPN